ncbi:PIG-L family deacetylase [Candidatus Woesebacteria bacterium]|nr:PIG-L family deacetylase [Candidatus Woesebacteria bacterium]
MCILVYALAVLTVNDFSILSGSIDRYKHILVLFPHPDDEVFSCGGTIKQAVKKGIRVTVATMTKGEKGTPDGHEELSLKTTRAQELQKALSYLGVTDFILNDFGDGELEHKRTEITAYVANLIKQLKPDLVITYDTSGFYGHPDHIVLAEVVTKLVKTSFPDVTLWYTTAPQKSLDKISLPVHMAQDPAFHKRRTLPTHKIVVARGIYSKVRAMFAHQSQMPGFKKSFPAYLPLWLSFSCMIVEYFHQYQRK